MTVFVCGACGRVRDRREDFEDVSCYLNAVECEEKSLKKDENGYVIYATAIKEEGGRQDN